MLNAIKYYFELHLYRRFCNKKFENKKVKNAKNVTKIKKNVIYVFYIDGVRVKS